MLAAKENPAAKPGSYSAANRGLPMMTVMVVMVVIRGIRRYRGSGKNRQTKDCKHQIPKLHGRSPLFRRRLPFPATVNI